MFIFRMIVFIIDCILALIFLITFIGNAIEEKEKMLIFFMFMMMILNAILLLR
jgi:hypothetical protein